MGITRVNKALCVEEVELYYIQIGIASRNYFNVAESKLNWVKFVIFDVEMCTVHFFIFQKCIKKQLNAPERLWKNA